jgi:hypothetical protein
VWLALFAIPALVLWVPLIAALEVALTAVLLPALMLLLAMMLALLAMPLRLTGNCRRWIVAASLVVSLVALVRAEFASGATDARKRPNSLSHLVDADSAKAWWFTFDRSVDDWTATRLGAAPDRVDLSGYGLGTRATPLLAAADANAVTSWTAPILTTSATPGGRRVRVHVAHAGEGQMIQLMTASSVVVTAMSINGRALQDGQDDRYSPQYHAGKLGNILRYFGVPPEGVDVEFTIHGIDATAMRIVSGIQGLPGMPIRPANRMSKPFVPTDMSFVAWTVRI